MWKKESIRWIWWTVSKGMWKSTFFFFPYLVWKIQESADTIGRLVEDQREKSLERQRMAKDRVLKVRAEERTPRGAGGQGERKMTCQGEHFGRPARFRPFFFRDHGGKLKAAVTEAGCVLTHQWMAFTGCQTLRQFKDESKTIQLSCSHYLPLMTFWESNFLLGGKQTTGITESATQNALHSKYIL